MVWSQQLELVIQATQRQAVAKERVSRANAIQYDPKARITRSAAKGRSGSAGVLLRRDTLSRR